MKRILLIAACAAAALALASCSTSDDGGSGPGAGTPTVTSMSITDGETDVGLVGKITATFSEDMDPATINDTTFVVAGRSASGYVEYDEPTRTASFLPDSLLAPETWHELMITDDATDVGGTPCEESETSFQTGAVTCDNLTDHMEPNDSVGEATPIEIDRSYYTLTGCDDDTDFFEFTLDETVKILARAEFRRANDENCYLYLRRAAGDAYSWVGTSVNDGQSMGTTFTFLPGTYYVEVVGTNGYEDWTLYDLRLQSQTPCRDDDYEDNDFIDEAPLVSPGLLSGLRGCYNDRDWFAVQADAYQTIGLTATVLEGSAQVTVGIYGPSEDELATDSGWSGAPVHVSAQATESGTHYVFAKCNASDIIYDLQVTISD